MPCTNRNCFSMRAGHLRAGRPNPASEFRPMSLVILVVALNIILAAGTAKSAWACAPAGQPEPGTTHGVTLPGAVEVTGSAAVPQHPIVGPPPGNAAVASAGNAAGSAAGLPPAAPTPALRCLAEGVQGCAERTLNQHRTESGADR
jgi:hypothetical protein